MMDIRSGDLGYAPAHRLFRSGFEELSGRATGKLPVISAQTGTARLLNRGAFLL